jgi:lysozyme
MMWRDIEEAARRLMDLFPLKAAAGVCLLSLEQHALMFLAFSLLVAMDCLSRWLAISAGMLKEKSGEIPPLLLSLLSIPEARRKGLISSKVMKEAGLSKLSLQYLRDCCGLRGLSSVISRKPLGPLGHRSQLFVIGRSPVRDGEPLRGRREIHGRIIGIIQEERIMRKGIDVSCFNDGVDWKEVRGAGMEFAIIRLGYGHRHLDELFYKHVNGALDAGLLVGTYYYSYALCPEDAKDEARFTVDILEDCGLPPERLAMGCWFDMEDADEWKTKHDALDPFLLTDMCTAYVEQMEDLGYPAGVYASLSWLEDLIETRNLPLGTPLWCARWGNEPGFPGVRLWQYTDKLPIGNQYFDGDIWF